MWKFFIRKTEHLTKRFPDLRKLSLNWVLYFILTLLKLMQFLGWEFPTWTNWHAIQSHAGITTQFCWISQSFTNRYRPTNFSAGRILQWRCFLLSDRHSSVNKLFIGWKSSQAQIIIFFDWNNEVNYSNQIHAKFVEQKPGFYHCKDLMKLCHKHLISQRFHSVCDNLAVQNANVI